MWKFLLEVLVARRSPQMSGFWEWFKSNPESPQGYGHQPTGVDLYQVLGVSPTASHEDIKSAFREQALKFHPDRNPDDPVAEAKYTALSSAYAILGDEVQRAAYDRMRPAPEAPAPHGWLVPRPQRPGEQTAETPPTKKKAQKRLDTKSMINSMFAFAKEEPPARGSMFDVLSPDQPPPQPMFSSPNPSGSSMMPPIEIPDYNHLEKIVEHWPLEDFVWPQVRELKWTPAFQKAGAAAIDALAGWGDTPAEYGLAEDWFDIPVWQVDQYVKTAGRDALYTNVMYPIFAQVTKIMDRLKPPDISGRFFLDWDPTGRIIELIYAENSGRRP